MECQKKLQILLDLGKVISKENSIDILLNELSSIASELVDGDRASIFIYDPINSELWTRVAMGVENTIRIPVDKGIAGSTVITKEAQIVRDAYNDPRFFREVDKATGYRTDNILTVPMVNMKKEVIGVFQVLNKKEGIFETKDAKMLLLLADYTASILENALLYKELEEKYQKSISSLEKSEKRLELIALTTSDGVWDWNIETNEVYYSSKHYQILGYKENELDNTIKTFFKIIHKEDLPNVKKMLRKKEAFRCEFRARTKSGKYIWLLSKGEVIKDDKGTAKRLVGSNTNITYIKEHEEKLKVAYQEIETLLNDQDHFIKSAIHEINTPITVINTYLEVLEKDIEHPIYLKRIISATKTLSSIYDDFNYYINKNKNIYKKEKLNFSEFLMERCDYFKDIAEANNQLITKDIKENIFIEFSKIELRRVIDNTLSNAIKYNREKKSVALSLSLKGGKAVISIKDEGNGIENPKKVFERYYREDNHKGGFGIGLNIVKSICDNNGVEIIVDSRIGEGTTFTYLFNRTIK